MTNMFELHDSCLMGISVTPERHGQLTFLLVGGQKTVLNLQGIEYLVANDFREGNIVLDVMIQKGKEHDQEYLDLLLGKEYLQKNSNFKDSLVNRIVSGELILIAVEPSYGCALVALCKTYSWDSHQVSGVGEKSTGS